MTHKEQINFLTLNHPFSENSLDDIIHNKVFENQPNIVRIKIDGKYYKTPSGKTAWNAKNHATLALRHDLSYKCSKIATRERLPLEVNYYDYSFDVFLKQMLDSGRIEYEIS